MKKILIMLGVIAASMQVTTARAQAYMGTGAAENDPMIFNHLSAGLDIGTDGWGLEVAAPLTPYVSVRTGLASIPKIGFTVNDIDIKNSSGTTTEKVSLDFKLKMTDWKLLFDVHPFKTSSFRLTFGAYIGGEDLVTTDYFGGNPGDPGYVDHRNEFVKIGDQRVSIDDQNRAQAAIKVKKFKPYVGLGFGRAVKSAPGLTFNFDAGVQFWGKPEVWGTTYHLADGKYYFEKIDVNAADNDDAKEAAKWLTKISVWPTVAFRLTYTIF